MYRPVIRAAVAASALLGLASGSVHAVDATSSKAAPQSTTGLLSLPNVSLVTAAVPQPQQASEPAASAGLRAFKDKDTGRLRNPTVEELTALDAPRVSSARAARAPVTQTLPSGMRFVEVDESFDAYSVIRRSPDGQLHADCADGEHAAMELMSTETREEHGNDR